MSYVLCSKSFRQFRVKALHFNQEKSLINTLILN
jgi:hypothetical protein